MERNRDPLMEFLIKTFQGLQEDGRLPKTTTQELHHVITSLYTYLKGQNLTPNDLAGDKNRFILGYAFHALIMEQRILGKGTNEKDLEYLKELMSNVKNLLKFRLIPEKQLKEEKQLQEEFIYTLEMINRLTKKLEKDFDPSLKRELDKCLENLEELAKKLNLPIPSPKSRQEQDADPHQQVKPPKGPTAVIVLVTNTKGEVRAAEGVEELGEASSVTRSGGSKTFNVVETDEKDVERDTERRPAPSALPTKPRNPTDPY